MNKYIKTIMLWAVILFSLPVSAQISRISGTVSDEFGGIPGIQVKELDSNNRIVSSAITDANGNFTLPKVPNNAKTLDISYLGMETQSVSVAATVSVVLKENVLEEAVVMGYGTAKKLGTVVGTVSKITSDKIENKPVTTALDALQGKVAGVQIYNNTVE